MCALALCFLVLRFHASSALRLTNKVDEARVIPNRLVFNYKVNLLKDKSDLPQHTENIKKTIKIYPDMKVEFFDDADCYAAIKAIHSQNLADYFSKESNGAYKSDLCRLAQLAEKGGYYLDNDIEPISDMRKIVPAHAAFVSSQEADSSNIFQAVLGVAPNHPVIKRALNLTFEHYRHAPPQEAFFKLTHQEGMEMTAEQAKQRRWLGPEMMASAWQWWVSNGSNDLSLDRIKRLTEVGAFTHPGRPAPLQHSYMFVESNQPQNFGTERRPAKGCCCNYVVADEGTKTAVFFSRFVGAGPICRK